MTMPQLNEAFGKWVATQTSVKKRLHHGHRLWAGPRRAKQSFQTGFKAGGGKVVGSVRMAVANPDFSAYVQRAKDLKPQGIFVFIPGGAQPARSPRHFAERGVDSKNVKILATGEIIDEQPLKSMGDAAHRLPHRLALRLQSQVQAERGLRQGLQRGISPQPGLLLGRRL